MAAVHAIQSADASVDEGAVRAAFGRFTTGVAFVTADVDGTALGLIVSSFAAVSLQPPLVSFCAGRSSLTWQRMRHAGRFTIHFLGAGHGEWARRAAQPGADRFAQPEVLRAALAAIECDVEAEHPAGDHWIVVGRVRALQVPAEGRPLVYFGGRFGDFQAH
jgi:3-hydroxy-9,10-secoandrosta-1,3,5(10)-triene-9,17-dione monooxygenase reductase component